MVTAGDRPLANGDATGRWRSGSLAAVLLRHRDGRALDSLDHAGFGNVERVDFVHEQAVAEQSRNGGQARRERRRIGDRTEMAIEDDVADKLALAASNACSGR